MPSDTLDLARLQFALTASFHFLFVALTLGLATIVVGLQLRATLTRSDAHAKMLRFWGQLYVINYAMGILTGLVMELQFGLSWSGLTHFAGDVFGAAVAMETLVAFFIESTFLGLWIFGWGRLNRWVHLGVIVVVTLTAYVSAYWILVANGLMQSPAGVEIRDGRLELTDLGAVVANPATLTAFGHIVGAALTTAGILVAGISAYHLYRRTRHMELFGPSLRIGVYVALPALLLAATFGGLQLELIGDIQPMKLASFTADDAELARIEADMTDELGPGDYAPPGLARIGAFVMLGMFSLMETLLLVSGLLALSRRRIVRSRLWHVTLMAAIPLPYVAVTAGWLFREVGRQPWIVYGMLSVEDAVSDVSDTAMRASLLTFTSMFAVLIVVTVWLMARHARRGPDTAFLGPAATRAGEPSPSETVLTFVGR